MQNNLSDLNNHLFEQLELLSSGKLSNERLEKEIKKTKAMTSISSQILKIASIQISAIKTAEQCGLMNQDMPSLIATKDSKNAELEKEKAKMKLLGVSK